MKKQSWRKVLIIVLCITMILVSSPEVFAVGIDAAICAADAVLSPKASETKSNARVQAVIDKIDAIGTVEYTGESLSKIVVAEKAYDALKSDEKLKVTNYGTLKAARAAYDALATDRVDTSSYTVKDTGVLSSGINWFVYDNGVLEISGEGKVPTYSAGGAPWYSYASSINTILVRSSVTGIGAFAFYGCDNVTDITLPFVGASRTATGYQATFGYIFGCSSAANQYSTSEGEGSFASSQYRTTSSEIFVNTNGKQYSCYNFYGRIGCTYYSRANSNDNKYSYGYVRSDYTFYIPTSLTTVKITDASKIEMAAFNNCQHITKITLNDGITSVGDYAFQLCTGLKDHAIPETVSTIGSYAYYGDTALTEMYIPDAVTKINDYTFCGCTKINRLKISKYATSIGSYAFSDLSSLPAISIPNNVKTVGSYTFANCTAAASAYIPDSVTTINSYAFSGCSAIDAINIPDSVTSLGSYAFSGCSAAKTLAIGSGVESINGYTFQNCTGLTSVMVPDTVTSIAAFAFYGCDNVTDITLPFVGASRTATGYQATFGYIFGCSTQTAFAGYTNQYDSYSSHKYRIKFSTNIYNGATKSQTDTTNYTGYDYDSSNKYSNTNRVRTSSSTQFSNKCATTSTSYPASPWYSLFNYYNSADYVSGKYWLRTYYFNVPAKLATVKITDASKIETAAFNNCQYITKITLNDGITSVGDYAFQHNPWYSGLTDEFVIDGDNVLIKYNGTKSTVTIPDTAKYIGGGVFQNKSSVSSVTLPEELLGIDNLAFDGCSGLFSMTIPKSVTRIGTNAIPSSCNIRVYRPSAGYNYRSSNRTVLNGSYTTGDDTYYYIIGSDDKAEIIGCTTTSTELTVPEEIEGHIVSAIGDYGFSGCTTLKSITIPTNIKTIGKYAFNGCTGLVNATIPTTVGSVGDYAFNNCTGLQYVTISEGVKSIGKGCFYNCVSLVEAVVPDSAEKLGSYAFYNCTSMTTATIGITADAVREYTFYGCKKLDSVVIGINVASIGDYAFYNCALTKVSVPAATTYIGKYAFANNKAMTKATHRKGLQKIDEFAYQNCSSLETVTFGETSTSLSGLTTIGKGAFQNCSALVTAALPKNLTSLGSYAFDGCSSLPTVTIPAGVTVINDCTFNKCTSLASVTINSNATSIGFDAFRECAFSAIVLPSTVVTIHGGAFRGCANLSEITIPDATKTIGEAAFFDCTALAQISVADSLENFGDSALKNNNNLTAMIRYLSGTITDGLFEKQGICHAVLDENITTVGSRAFAYCYDLSDITYGERKAVSGEFLFSENVISLGSEVFKDAFLLKNLIIPDTIQTIGVNAFYNSVAGGYHTQDVTVTFYYVGGNIAANILKAQKVSHIVVNDNIKTLGDNAFYGISILETVSLPDTITACGVNVFASSSGNVTAYFRGVDGTVDKGLYKAKLSDLTYLVFDENINTIDSYAFANTSTVKGVVVHSTDTIKDHAFADSTSIYGVVIENAGLIDEYAFNNCSAANYVEIGTANKIGKYAFSDSSTKRIELDDINTIDDYAFSNCITMQKAYIDSVININDYAFFNDIAIDDLVIDENLVHIGKHAFEECKLVPKLVLPETVRDIGECAFYDCNSLQSINIPAGVEIINKSTFFGCASLLAIKLPDTVKTVAGYAYYGCVLVKDLSLGNSITTIGEYAFYNCNQVKEIKLPKSVTTIGDYAFRSCSSITEIAIPDNVISLGDCVFYGCVGLQQAEFGIGITSIGDRVFYGCVDMTKLVLNGDINYIHDLAFYGAEDTAIYAYTNDYVKEYCDDMGLEYHEMASHTFGEWQEYTSATFNEDGESRRYCQDCDYYQSKRIPKLSESHEHSYTGKEEVIKDASCTEPGSKKVYCFEEECGSFITVSINPKGHVYDNDQDANCNVCGAEREIEKEPTLQVTSISVETLPEKTEYNIGETFDATGLKIKVHYSDNSSETLTEGFEIHGFDSATAGTKVISLTYAEQSVNFNVTVKAAASEQAPVTFEIGNSRNKPGETFKVDLNVNATTEVDALLLDTITYDTTALEFLGFSDATDIITKSVLGAASIDSERGEIMIGFQKSEVPVGKLCSLEFKVLETASEGDISISMQTFASKGGKEISSDITNGTATIYKWLEGDFDCNGEVNMQDAVYFVGWINFSFIPGRYTMVYDGDLDFNKDGEINMQDAVYFVGWVNFSFIPGRYTINW